MGYAHFSVRNNQIKSNQIDRPFKNLQPCCTTHGPTDQRVLFDAADAGTLAFGRKIFTRSSTYRRFYFLGAGREYLDVDFVVLNR